MPRKPRDGHTYDLFEPDHPALGAHPALEWPDAARFPLNVDGRTVRETVLGDLRGAVDPLVVAGYAALDELIDLVAGLRDGAPMRFLLGNEPYPGKREDYRLDPDPFPREVEAYWLDHGISLLLSAKLVRCIDRLKAGDVEARYLDRADRRLHAKLYVGDEGATIGSSNFTRSGLDRQLEANARFSRARDAARYRELRDVAENFWQLGRDYRDELVALLEKLLRVVTWREALARACAELLDGAWAERFLRGEALLGASELWPSQRQGIARALYVLDRQGSVLIADATGSGKTRMGAHLVRAAAHRMLAAGRLRYGRALMVCPPAVADGWERERVEAGAQLDVQSHGTLSHARSRRHDLVLESLRQAQILCVDEGHNFLNTSSNRTRQLLGNMADHVVLFTATPINKSVADLLRIADMLGADNLERSTLDTFRKLLGARQLDRTLTEAERRALRTEIQRFTVRRTKRELNALIDRDPGAYRDARGERCRFPRHRPETYPLGESGSDREAAAEIRRLAGELRAATHFRKPLEMPEVLRREGYTEERFLARRLESARKLARYIVMASLRSSRAALIEHIEGTDRAVRLAKLASFKRQRSSGDMLGLLSRIAGDPPENRLSVPVPDWLTDPDAHRAACQQDRRIYARIMKLIAQMGDGREQRKVDLLLQLARRHGLVLAFDSRPITLAYVAEAIGAREGAVETLVATGDQGSERLPLLRTFAPGSTAAGVVGLCSDSLAEGVNLQQAPCMVHLDMPSVVRVAEQRVGRVDRMDSPHREIEAWWPDDAPEFALSSDERFVERYETVESLLGSNMPLPEEMQRAEGEQIGVEQLIAEFERSEISDWDGIEDAFAPVRALVEGDAALVDAGTYGRYRDVGARVLSRVSLVRARRSWAFFCLGGGNAGAPRWVLFPDASAAPITDLDAVSAALRARLGADAEDLPMDERAAGVVERFSKRLGAAERSLLPRRKQRALEEMERVLGEYEKVAGKAGEAERARAYQAIRQVLRAPRPERQPDWDEMASRWLELVRPIWYDRLKGKRTKPLLLADIRPELLRREGTFGPACLEAFRSLPVVPAPSERIRACIVGVP